MKHIVFFHALLISIGGWAQTNPNFNADFDGDDCVGLVDLLGVLSVFGTCTNWECGHDVLYLGHSYGTVEIGEQCWFAENLRSTEFRDGTPIPQLQSEQDWVNAESPGWCFYENENGLEMSDFGMLYNFYVVGNNMCPVGWRVPNFGEWFDSGLREWMIENFPELGMESAGLLRSVAPYEWNVSNDGATDVLGFHGRPSGGRRVDGSFIASSVEARFHINNTFGGGWAQFVFLRNENNTFDRSGPDADFNTETWLHGSAIRCLKETE